jgi:hypothetical protein
LVRRRSGPLIVTDWQEVPENYVCRKPSIRSAGEVERGWAT